MQLQHFVPETLCADSVRHILHIQLADQRVDPVVQDQTGQPRNCEDVGVQAIL
jgi:hypothetical protein